MTIFDSRLVSAPTTPAAMATRARNSRSTWEGVLPTQRQERASIRGLIPPGAQSAVAGGAPLTMEAL